MPRLARSAPGGQVYHVLNRSAGRITLFRRDADYLAFERVMVEALERHPLRICSYCIMPNHWHFIVWPRKDGDLTAFFRWLAHTHAMRWRVARHTVGQGHLYQGRFKCFPIQPDNHFRIACRYIERNPLTAQLARRAADWPWSSLWARQNQESALHNLLADWPVQRPANWPQRVEQALTTKEVERMQLSLKRSHPLGDDAWTTRIARRLGLTHTLRKEGRPPKKKD